MAIHSIRPTALCASVLLVACHGGGGGGGGGGGAPPPVTYTVGGTLSGLSGSGLVLRNNTGNDLAVAAGSGTFAFSTGLVSGAPYSVTVATQPTNPSQTCAVSGGSGTVGAANVSSVQIACTTNTFTVGATVTGLDADGLVLQNNGANDLAVASDGSVTFPGQTASGAAYAITVETQPTLPALPFPAQFCTVANGTGMVGSAAVNVAVTCAAPVFKYLYVSNLTGDSVSGYAVDVSTGALSAVPNSPFATGPAPSFATPGGNTKFLYVATKGDSGSPPRPFGYTVDSASGELTPLPASPFDLSVTMQPPGTSFVSVPVLLLHRSAAFAYAVGSVQPDGASRLFGLSINSVTGELVEINPQFPMDIGFAAAGPGTDSGGRILFVTTNPTAGATTGEIRTFRIDTPSGTLTPVDVVPTANASLSLPFIVPGDDFLIVFERNAGTLEVFRIGKTQGAPDGTLTAVGGPVPTGPPGSRPFVVNINRRNHVLYVTNGTGGSAPPSLATFSMDPSTGALTAIGTPISTNNASGGAVLHPSGRFLFQSNASITGFQTFAIDPTTFAPTLESSVSPWAQSVGGISVDFSGKYLYTSDATSNTVSSYRIDTTTHAITLVNTLPAGQFPSTISAFGFQPQ